MSDLGTARGRILIDTSGVRRAQQEVQSAGQGMTRALQAIGVGFSIQQFTRFAVEADAMATAFRRQSVAARELAGNQGRLNDLLRTYEQATGGAISNAQALSDVTRLMATGFADSTQELEQFVRAVRGISLATGRPQEFIVTNLQLELLNQTGFRLDQLGLGMQEVQQRAEALRAANSALTQQQAYQNAVLEIANRKFGELTKSAAAQASGVEDLTKAWANFRLEVGQSAAGGAIDFVARAMANWLRDTARDLRIVNELLFEMGQMLGVINRQIASPRTLRFVQESSGRDVGRHPQAGRGSADLAPSGFTAEQEQEIFDNFQAVQEIERQAALDRLEATRQYEEQRSSIIRQYAVALVREAEDFARQRARAEEDYQRSIVSIREAAARREAQAAVDLERSIASARADSAERLADMQAELDRTLAQRRADSQERIAELEADRAEQIAERRADSAARILELEEDFTRARERAQRDARDRLFSAAAQFDAIAIAREQRRLQREDEEQRIAHAEQLAEEQKQLDEGITQLNEAHRKRLDEEARSLQKSIAQAQEAHKRQVANEARALEKRIEQQQEAYTLQLERAREADALRLADMEADFRLRQAREDEDRRVRLRRMAEDHTQQLTELDRQHVLRMEQIDRQEGEALEAQEDAHNARLNELSLHNAKWLAEQQLWQNEALRLHTQYWQAQLNAFKGLTQGPSPLNPALGGGTFPPTLQSFGGTPPTPSSTTTTNTAHVSAMFNIYQSPGQDPQQLVSLIDRYLRDLGNPYPY